MLKQQVSKLESRLQFYDNEAEVNTEVVPTDEELKEQAKLEKHIRETWEDK